MSSPKVVRRIASRAESEKKKVAAYCRVSTKKDAQEESLETQEAVYREQIALKPEWELAGIYVDAGRTGTSAKKRPAFQQMIEDAKAGKIQLILVKSISRFARNVVDSQRYVQMLKEWGVYVHFEKENVRTEDPTSTFVFSLLSAIAQDESHSISENVKWTYHKNFEQGKYNLGNNRILGYDCIEGKLVPNQDAWIVKEAFYRFLAGENCRQIADELTAMGAKALRSERGIAPQTIQAMLANETYVGDKRLQKRAPVDCMTKEPDPNQEYHSYYLTDDHEELVDRKTWEAVQHILERRKAEVKSGIQKRGKEHHVLYGKVFCGVCGAPFTRRTYRSGRKTDDGMNYKAWICKERRNGKGCKNPMIREEKLLKEISRALGWEEKVFDAERFEELVDRVEVFEEGIVVKMIEVS